MTTAEAVERLRRMEQRASDEGLDHSLEGDYETSRMLVLDAEALRLAVESLSRDKP